MRHRFSSTTCIAFVTWALGGCANALPPCMAAAPQPVTTPTSTAIVVFAREGSACDVGGFVRIVETDGAYVGDVASEARFAVALAPGAHTFVAWDTTDFPSRTNDARNWTSTVKATLEAGRIYYVSVKTALDATIRSCSRWPGAALVPLTSHNGRGGDVASLLASTEPQLPKAECGAAAVRDAKAVVDRHIREGLSTWAHYGEQTRRDRTILAEDGVVETP